MSNFKKVKTPKGEIVINTDNISYVDSYTEGSRIVMNDGTVFLMDESKEDVIRSISSEQKIVVEFDKTVVHNKNNNKKGNKHGKAH